jgi:hypothetical protein
MSERLMYSWDDDEGGHTICSDCLKAFGNAAACRNETNAQDAVCEMCDHGALDEKD